MRILGLIGGLLAGVVLFGAMPADAKSCQELLAGKSYRCTTVTQGVEGTAEVCARFVPAPDGLALLIDGTPMWCACEHSGSLGRARYGASAEFGCIGAELALTGKASKTKLEKVFSRTYREGATFAASCVLDPACLSAD